MKEKLGVGIIGCGNISAAYLRLAPLFKGIEVVAVADQSASAAEARANEFGVRALTVDGLLADQAADIIVNLTVPAAHVEVSIKALAAGKHVYSEKPLALSLGDGKRLLDLANSNGLRVACAPDTFLGGAHQQVRAAIDAGDIGTVVSGTAHVMGHGMEHWHPNPDFFFQPGGGPVLDMGPYYIAALINLIGPVKRVAALTGAGRKSRTISSAPRMGEMIPVNVATTAHALLQFASGALVTFSASWDVYAHKHPNMEIYGSAGALLVPDPNFFGGEIFEAGTDAQLKPLAGWNHPLGVANQESSHGPVANYRTAGLADLAAAIRDNRDARCSIERTLHGVDVMTGILRSGETASFVDMTTTCTRPAALGIDEAKAMLA